MLPVRGLRFLQHLRPGTAEVSLRYIFGLGDRQMPIVKSDREQRGPREASIQRHRYPQPTDPGVCGASAGLVPDAATALLYARVSVPSPVKPGLLHGPMPATPFLERLSGARPRGLLMA